MNIRLPALIFLFGATISAHAADFTFHVPVELHGLQPEISQIRVNCLVQSTPYPTNNPYVNVGAAVSPAQPVSNGEINTMFEVQVNAYSGKDPALARSYTCDLHMYADGAWFIAKTNPKYPLDPSKPSKTVATGLLPN